MKKLILILICLFVSFEVKSESDDLTGKKLLCGNNSLDIGLEFLTDSEVKYYDISHFSSKHFNKYNYDITDLVYETELERIIIWRNDKKTFDDLTCVHPKITERMDLCSPIKYLNRSTLVLEHQCTLLEKEDGRFRCDDKCILTDMDLKDYFDKEKNKKLRNLKSKQKI